MKIRLDALILSPLLLFISVLLFYPMFMEFYNLWSTDPEASSTLLIPFFSAYMIWTQKSKLQSLNFNLYDDYFSKNGFFLLIGGLALYILGRFTNILLIQVFAFILIVIAIILFLYGKELSKITLAPTLFLVFILPLPVQIYYAIAGHLKYVIAKIVIFILMLIRIPLIAEGNVLHFPSGSLVIHEVCSGIQTIISIVAISCAFAYMFLESRMYRIILILIAVPIGLITNIIRVLIIGVLSSLFDVNTGMSFHENAWVVVTPVGFLLTFLTGNLFRCYERKNT